MPARREALTEHSHRRVRRSLAPLEQGLEGIIAKRTTSTYQPGRRSPAWRKSKNIRTVDVLIGGWSPGGGRHTGTIGSARWGSLG
jgi:bifunctional non-homologous end joining protein LigD